MAGMLRQPGGRRIDVYGAKIDLGGNHRGKLGHKGRTHKHAKKMHHLKKHHHHTKKGKGATYATFGDAMKAFGLME